MAAEPQGVPECPSGTDSPQRGSGGALRASYEIPPSRRRNLLRMYGLTTEDFVALLLYQDDMCPMCLKPFRSAPTSRMPHVEHCHPTGEVHGLADHRCNELLGYYGRDPEYYERVAAFLRTPPAREALGRRHYVPGAPPREETT